MSDDDGERTVEARVEEPPARVFALREVAIICAVVVLAETAVIAFAFSPARAGSWQMLASIGGVYVVLGALAITRLYRAGELGSTFRFARGDIWLGGMVAGLLHVGAMLGHMLLTPRGSPREAWVMLLYLQIGDPRGEGHELAGAAVFVLAVLEEIVWRGYVMRALEDVMGSARALIVSSCLFALTHTPTLFLLADGTAGLNPLVVTAALGCSLVWGLVVLRSGRLPAALIAHGLFSWSIVELPIWRP